MMAEKQGSDAFGHTLEQPREALFRDAVLAGAKAKADALVKAAEVRAKHELAEARRACEAADPERISAECEAEAAQQTGGLAYEARQELLRYRHSLVGAMFADIEGQLREYVDSEAYPAALAQRLAGIECAEGSTAYLRQADMHLAAGLEKTLPGLRFEADGSIRLGGFRLRDGKRLYDHTLDTALEQERERFAAEGALRL